MKNKDLPFDVKLILIINTSYAQELFKLLIETDPMMEGFLDNMNQYEQMYEIRMIGEWDILLINVVANTLALFLYYLIKGDLHCLLWLLFGCLNLGILVAMKFYYYPLGYCMFFQFLGWENTRSRILWYLNHRFKEGKIDKRVIDFIDSKIQVVILK